MAPMTVDQAVALIVAAQDLAQVGKDVVPALRKLEKTTAKAAGGGGGGHAHVFESVLTDGQDPLEVLDPAVHSAGYLFVLNARCAAENPDLAQLTHYATPLCQTGDAAQLRLVPDQVLFFARQFAQIAHGAGQPELAVPPLLQLINRCATPNHLTPLHGLLLQVVMATQTYQHVEQLLNTDIVDLDMGLGPVKYHDNLLYHYLGGVIIALLGNYQRAADLLEIVVSAPAQAVAAIQVDAYKKLVLVQLLATGQTVHLKYTSAVVANACKNLCAPYNDYATAYAKQDKLSLAAVVMRHGEMFQDDLNMGLIELCAGALRRRAVQRLTETYMTLSLQEIARAMDLPTDQDGLNEAKKEIHDMLDKGEVHGSVSETADGDATRVTVTFTDDPEPYNTHETAARVTRAIERAALLDRDLVARDWQVGRSKEFVQKAYLAAGSMSQGMGGVGGAEDFDLASMVPGDVEFEDD